MIVSRTGRGAPKLDARVVKRRASRMLAAIDAEGAELSVTLTDDAEILVLNRAHRKKAKPTDVLAFPMDETGPGPSGRVRLLGDVVISLETALRQARERRHGLLDEVTHLLAHGLLHLVGYDHRTDREELRMNAEASRLVLAATGNSARRKTLSRSLRDRS